MPLAGQLGPRETQAGIDLALGRDVGMADDVARHDGGMAADDAAAKLDQSGDLDSGIVVAIAVQVHDLDADRGGVQSLAATPMRTAGMPGDAIFGHQPIGGAVLCQDVVCADAIGPLIVT